METIQTERVNAEFKAKILKEINETGNSALVARTHGLKYATVVSWVRLSRQAPAKKAAKDSKSLDQKLAKLELENRILKELLKKTNQAWLTDDESQLPS